MRKLLDFELCRFSVIDAHGRNPSCILLPSQCARTFSCPSVREWSGNETNTALFHCRSVLISKRDVFNSKICLLQKNLDRTTLKYHCRSILLNFSFANVSLCLHCPDILHILELRYSCSVCKYSC